tara:strand:- start:638 stop:1216 length:579 start_codon:yes stop_codon:yes gene_type:complete
MSELFVETPSVPTEPVKKPRKKREPMSAEKKAEFAARMKASREQKKIEKEQAKAEKEQAKAVPVPKEKVEPKVVKPKKNLRHVPNELDIHKHEIDCLKNELLVLKRNKKNNKDMEEVRALKQELIELRDAAKAYKQSLKKKEEPPIKENIKVEIKEPVKEEVVEQPIKRSPPITIPKPKYSTYQKSIWSQFT